MTWTCPVCGCTTDKSEMLYTCEACEVICNLNGKPLSPRSLAFRANLSHHIAEEAAMVYPGERDTADDMG